MIRVALLLTLAACGGTVGTESAPTVDADAAVVDAGIDATPVTVDATDAAPERPQCHIPPGPPGVCAFTPGLPVLFICTTPTIPIGCKLVGAEPGMTAACCSGAL